jgi:hypothetical protein
MGVVDHSTTSTPAANKETRAPRNRRQCVEGSFNRRGEVSVQRVSRLSASHTPHAPKPTARGAAIEARVPIPQVLFGYFLPKKVTTRKAHTQNSALCLRHGVGRDGSVLGWRSGRESRATRAAPESCPAAIGHGGAVSLHCCAALARQAAFISPTRLLHCSCNPIESNAVKELRDEPTSASLPYPLFCCPHLQEGASSCCTHPDANAYRGGCKLHRSLVEAHHYTTPRHRAPHAPDANSTSSANSPTHNSGHARN